VLDVCILVRNRAEFTALALAQLERCTNFSHVRRLLLVNDSSTDGADDVCRGWVRRVGFGEVVDVRAGTVTNALFQGTEALVDDPPRHLVKLDNDFMVCEGWLEIMLAQVALCRGRFEVYGFSTPNDFFVSAPDDVWNPHAAEDYALEPTAYTGGNFLIQWGAFLRTRHLGVTQSPTSYVTGSISEIHRRLSIEGRLRCCVVKPHLPVFKLDKALDPAFDGYRFFERRGLDRARIASLVHEYAAAGSSRKDLVGGRVVNRF
jgi:hypothetical protein